MKTPTGTYTTRYRPVLEDMVVAALQAGAAVTVEPFEDMWTLRWWFDND